MAGKDQNDQAQPVIESIVVEQQSESSIRMEAYLKIIADSLAARPGPSGQSLPSKGNRDYQSGSDSEHSNLTPRRPSGKMRVAGKRNRSPEETDSDRPKPKNSVKRPKASEYPSNSHSHEAEFVPSVKSKVIRAEVPNYLNRKVKGKAKLKPSKCKAPLRSNELSLSDVSETSDSGSEADYSHDDIEALENLDLVDEEKDSSKADQPDDPGLKILGGPVPTSWDLPPRAFSWYKKICDLELKSDDIKSLKEKYHPADDLIHHFEPPKIPHSLWESVKTSQALVYKQKVCFKAQESAYTAILPLLSVLESVPEEDQVTRDRLTESIQLICTSNLQMNRFRRALVGTFMKKDYKKSLMSLPVTHDKLFGDSFNDAVEASTKAQASTKKLLYQFQPRSSSTNKYKSQRQSRDYSSYKNQDSEQAYRQKDYSPSGYRQRNSYGRGYKPYYQNQRSRAHSPEDSVNTSSNSQKFRSRNRGRGSRGAKSQY